MKTKNIQNLSIGDTVYFQRPWIGITSDTICKVINDNCFETSHKSGYPYVLADEIYASFEDAMAAQRKASKDRRKLLGNDIKDIKDLVRFCLVHNVSGDPEYGDDDARAVALKKARKFGVEI